MTKAARDDAKGNVYESRGRWFARVSIGGGKRRSRLLPTCTTREQAEERAALIAKLVRQLREAGKGEHVEKTIDLVAEAEDRARLDRMLPVVAGIVAGRLRASTHAVPRDAVEALDRLGPIVPWPATAGVYYVRCLDRLKVGRARNIGRRLQAIQTAAPAPIALLAVRSTDAFEAAEAAAHARHARGRLVGEWFAPTPVLIEEIRQLRGGV